MSRFTLNQKLLALIDQFTVKDEAGEDRYSVKRQWVSIGRQLHVYDPDGNEVASIRQKVPALLPKFHVNIPGLPEILVAKELTLLRPRYSIQGLDWEVEGDVLHHDFSIRQGIREVARIRKRWGTLADRYLLDVMSDQDDLPALMVALAIDCCLMQARVAATMSEDLV